MRCRLFFLLASATFLVLLFTGCGGSTNNPTPQGGFSNANLNGTYAIGFSGTDANGFFAVAGSVTANGNGQITAGVLDLNSGARIATNAAVTGSYNIRPDGRGVAGLVTPAGNINLVFVLVAGNRALVTRFENSATGSGAMDLVNTGAFSTAALAGTLVFNLAGLDATGHAMATVGSATTNAAGTITNGVHDQSDNGAIVTNDPVTGSLQVAANGRGTMTLNTVLGTLNFAFYVVDANRLKMVETDTTPVLAGDAFRQSGAISNASVSGPFAFTVAGNDVALAAPLAAGGIFTSNGTGTITTGTQDVNDGGNVSTNIAITGTYSLAATGRGTISITGGTGTLNFVLYPTTSGVQLLETDVGVVSSGAAFAQGNGLSTGTLSGNYGMNYSAVTTNGELDSIASLSANGTGHMTGITDINNAGSTSSGSGLTVSYTVDATGRGPFTLQSPLGQQNMAVYVLNNSRALFIELDSTVVAAGAIEHQ